MIAEEWKVVMFAHDGRLQAIRNEKLRLTSDISSERVLENT